MRVLDLFKIFLNSKGFEKWMALGLAIIFGSAVPCATIFLKLQALAKAEFLFFGINLFSIICFWIGSIASAAFSLYKTYEFIKTAFNSKILAVLSCISLEMAFLHSEGLWFLVFILPVAISNIVQATVGFLMEETNKKEKKIEPEKQPESQPLETKKEEETLFIYPDQKIS